MMLFALTLIAATAAPGTATPEDMRNIALSTAIVQRIGDKLWPNWTQTPFAVDLVTAAGPIAINFPQPVAIPSFPPQLEATFPFPNGVPTIVIGEPQFTQASTPIRWSVTLLHEHFHQWQYSWPQYTATIKALNLAPPGDTNAMWMLNYPFPYKDPKTNATYVTMTHALARAVRAIGKNEFRRDAAAYVLARDHFKTMLKPDDYKYFAFQCWQEGTARYTEIMVARLAAAEHGRDPSFLTDADAAGLAQDSAATYERTLKRLETKALSDDDRVNFYALGGAEALLLDALKPGWRLHYFSPALDLGAFL